jgi:hypothetical protein
MKQRPNEAERLKSAPVAVALRRAGFVPCARWWVTPDQLEVVRRMALGTAGAVNASRRQVKAGRG